MKKWIEIVLQVSVVVLAVIVFRDTQAARKWLWDTVAYFEGQPPLRVSPVAPAPVPARLAGQPVPESPAESASPESAPAATPDPDAPETILAQLSADKAEWPQTVVCTGVINFPTLVKGNVTGILKVPAGVPLKLLDVQSDRITVGYLTTRQVVPASETNLVAQILAKRRDAQVGQ